MRYVNSCKSITSLHLIWWLFTGITAYALAAPAQLGSSNTQLGQLAEAKIDIQKIDCTPLTPDTQCSPQLLRKLAQARTAKFPTHLIPNTTSTDPEFYRIHITGTFTILFLEYHPERLVNSESRNMVIFGATGHLLAQRDIFGNNHPLLPLDDPYIITSLHPKQVVLSLQSVEPFRPTYRTALNIFVGVSIFYHESGRKGALSVLVADQTVSGRDDDADVAYIAIYAGPAARELPVGQASNGSTIA
ncbi:MAG: hypothetical protein Q9218_002179 [Villophora microphyllina]